jgi:hypothetical protein
MQGCNPNVEESAPTSLLVYTILSFSRLLRCLFGTPRKTGSESSGPRTVDRIFETSYWAPYVKVCGTCR